MEHQHRPSDVIGMAAKDDRERLEQALASELKLDWSTPSGQDRVGTSVLDDRVLGRVLAADAACRMEVTTRGEPMDTVDLPVAIGVAESQRSALDFARREAERAGCGITIVHAYTVPPSAMGPIYGLDVSEAYRAAGQEVLAWAMLYLSESGNTAPVECVLARGFAPAVLESESRSSRFMIIGPDKSKPWYIRMFEGKVARHLVVHAECPIIVVPDTWEESRNTAPIVVMVDGQSTAHGPLSFGFQIAIARHSELQVLHVTADAAEDLRTQWQPIRRVVDAWYEAHPDVSGTSQVVTGEAHEQAIRAASDAGLLVLGRPHEWRVASLLMDSLAQQIISEAGCPVAVVPAGYRG